MICLDTMILIWGLQRKAAPNYQHLVDRTQRYLRSLDEENETIMIPSPVVAEYLQGFDATGRTKQIAGLQRLFFIPSFDLPSAALTAELIENADVDKLRKNSEESRPALKVDVQIAAIAIVHGATRIVTHNISDFKNIVGGRTQVTEVPNIAEPGKLFDNSSEKG